MDASPVALPLIRHPETPRPFPVSNDSPGGLRGVLEKIGIDDKAGRAEAGNVPRLGLRHWHKLKNASNSYSPNPKVARWLSTQVFVRSCALNAFGYAL